jgi:hypothetical protein
LGVVCTYIYIKSFHTNYPQIRIPRWFGTDMSQHIPTHIWMPEISLSWACHGFVMGSVMGCFSVLLGRFLIYIHTRNPYWLRWKSCHGCHGFGAVFENSSKSLKTFCILFKTTHDTHDTHDKRQQYQDI